MVSRLTEYFTGTEYAPVQEIAESSETGPATVVLSGTSSGLESSVYAILAIAVAIGAALVLGDGNLQFSLYLVALTGMGMLATTGVIVCEDTFGPVSDNAAGIAEMSGEFHGEPERIMVSLDAVGNTTKAVTKGFAIGSAVIAAVALFASVIETIGTRARTLGQGGLGAVPRPARPQINVADPKTFIGLLIGGSVAFLFSALAIRAVGRTAGVVVQEVRTQFADGKIMSGEKQPDYGPVIDICTAASLRELATPALLAVLTPVIIGFGIGYAALGGFLAAVILTGQLMANYLSNAGGAWDNAKKYIEDGHHGGKGSEAHKAAVIGDTVGDPFKDTAGPALNPLIKVMNLVSLLILPAIINLQDNDAARFTIAGVSLVVLIGAIAFSKRKAPGMAAALAEPPCPPPRASERPQPGGTERARGRTGPGPAPCPAAARPGGSLRPSCSPAPRRRLPEPGEAARAGRPAPARRPSSSPSPGCSSASSCPATPCCSSPASCPRPPAATGCRRCPSSSCAWSRAAFVGDQVGYWFGKKVGPSLFDRPKSRLFNPANVVKAHGFFEQARAQDDRAGPLRAHRADVRPDRRRRRHDALPDVRDVQHHRRRAVGRRASRRSATSSARSRPSRTTSRSPSS